MRTAADDESQTVEPMSAELAARVTAFARACKAAARSVALYPGEHPAVAAALGAVTSAAADVTASGPLQLSVLPDTLHAAGRSMPGPDLAVTELAGILFRHQVGQLTLHHGTDAALWRRFLELLAQPAEDSRSAGGLGRAWATDGDDRLEIRGVDYDGMLRSRARGDRAVWDAILAGCLEGANFAVDDQLVELLADLVEDPERVADLLEAVAARMPDGDDRTQSAVVVAGLLQAVVRFVEQSDPAEADRAADALAEALTKLSVGALASIMESPRGAMSQDLRRFVQSLLTRVPDSAVASLVAREVQAGRGDSEQLPGVFHGLSPEPDRKAAIEALIERLLTEPGDGADSGADPEWRQAWERTRTTLADYGRQGLMPDSYRTELGRVFHRAIDLVRDHSDPPELLEEWRSTVDDAHVRLLDTKLLAELMHFRQDLETCRDLSALVLNRVNAFIVIGDLPAAALLVENLQRQSQEHAVPEIRTLAGQVLDSLATPAVMKHMAWHLDTTNQTVVQSARRLCLALGTSVVGPLTEALSAEERDRRRRHLAEILLAFGPPGRQIIERLCQSPSAAVRRTAIVLLRESAGPGVLSELVALLHDPEAHVQREAARALAELGLDEADTALVQAISRGPERERTSLLSALGSVPAADAERLWSRILIDTPWRRTLKAVHDEAFGRLVSLGSRGAVAALWTALQRRNLRAPFMMVDVHRRCLDALTRIQTPDARAAVEAAAQRGPRWVRAAARARLASLADPERSKGAPA